jgi:hypothetical protein
MPGFGENRLALSGLPSQSLASGGGSRFTVMFGQTRAYWVLISSHFSSPQSHQPDTPARKHHNRCIRRVDDAHVLTLIEAVDWTYLDTVHVLTFDTAFIDDVGQLSLLPPVRPAKGDLRRGILVCTIHGQRPPVRL